MRAAFRAESATEEPVPLGLFTVDAMNENRLLAMMPLLNHWGLKCSQRILDFPAIERLLADRYGYWDDDVPHDVLFPESGNEGSNGVLVVVKDMPPQAQA